MRLNQALPEGVPSGKADGMSVSTLSIADGRYRNTLRVLQLWGSACFQQLGNYQRRSGAVRHGAEHKRVRRHLAPVR
jgi:hypothetical protein